MLTQDNTHADSNNHCLWIPIRNYCNNPSGGSTILTKPALDEKCGGWTLICWLGLNAAKIHLSHCNIPCSWLLPTAYQVCVKQTQWICMTRWKIHRQGRSLVADSPCCESSMLLSVPPQWSRGPGRRSQRLHLSAGLQRTQLCPCICIC